MNIKRVGVIGTGLMGPGIAEVAAKGGFEVVLRSRTQASADASVAKLAASLTRQVDKGKLPADEAEATLSRVRAVTDMGDLELCDLVIESVVEDLAVKKELFAELDRICAPTTILATNTSTLSVMELAVATTEPARVCGLHFFNPAPVMPLVEIVPAFTTSDETLSAVREFAIECNKSPVLAQDRAGFIVNALLFPYLNGAVRMLEAGTASRDDIDTAMKGGCSFPMGPLELLDLVGLDTSLAILEALQAEHDDPCHTPAPMLRWMVEAGQLGRKSAQGFYTYPRSPAG